MKIVERECTDKFLMPFSLTKIWANFSFPKCPHSKDLSSTKLDEGREAGWRIRQPVPGCSGLLYQLNIPFSLGLQWHLTRP